MWTLTEVKQMIGRECGDPEVTSYPDAIQDHLIKAIEELADQITNIADMKRELTDEERVAYEEVVGISENEIFPLLKDVEVSPKFSNKVASIAINNTNFPLTMKVRSLFWGLQNVGSKRITKVDTYSEFVFCKSNPHKQPASDEIIWFNSGNKIHVLIDQEVTKTIKLYFATLTSLDYSAWSRNINLQTTVGFGSNFLVKCVKRAAYTMRLQLSQEKE